MTNFFKNSIVKKTTAALLLVCLSTFSFHAQAAGEIIISPGTRIELETVLRFDFLGVGRVEYCRYDKLILHF
jgi:hypothetical protein